MEWGEEDGRIANCKAGSKRERKEGREHLNQE